MIRIFCKTMLTICETVLTNHCLQLIETISLFMKQCNKFVPTVFFISKTNGKTNFSLITFKKRYEIINYGECFLTNYYKQCFVQTVLQTVNIILQNVVIKYVIVQGKLNICLNYNEVCLSICRLFEANRGLVKSK